MRVQAIDQNIFPEVLAKTNMFYYLQKDFQFIEFIQIFVVL
jgi:hypothetical protein